MTTTRARDLESIVVAAAADKDSINSPDVRRAVEEAVAGMDRGELSLAEKVDGEWKVNSWLQQAIGLYFRLYPMEELVAGPLVFHDRLPLKKDHAKRGVRVVPGGIARYGSYIEPGAVLMPSFVNIGAHVGRGTIVDTWATVGSGAWIGRDVHLSGGVGIGGVRARGRGRGARREHDAHRLDAHHRRHQGSRGHVQGPRTRALCRHPRHAGEDVPRR